MANMRDWNPQKVIAEPTPAPAQKVDTSAALPAVIVRGCVGIGGEPTPSSKLASQVLGGVLGGAGMSAAATTLPDPFLRELPAPPAHAVRRESRLRAIAEQAVLRAVPALPAAAPVAGIAPAALIPTSVAPLVAAAAPVATAAPVAAAAPVAPAPAEARVPAEARMPAVEPKKRALFRKEALDAHYAAGSEELEKLAAPRPTAWSALLVLASLVAVLFIGAAFATVEITVKAPGALRAPNGLRSVESVLAGAISEVLTHAGADVEAGQVVVRLEDAKLRSNLVLQERQLETLRQETEEAAASDKALVESTLVAARRQRGALQRRNGINHNLLKKRADRLANVQALVEYGAASRGDQLDVDESVQAASQSVALLDSQLVDLDVQMADRMREWQSRELERRTALSRMNAQVDEARSLIKLVEIRAPAAGRVESLLAKVGKVVQPGELMAQIVPQDAPRSIVAFLPSRETAFVSVGSEANVEVESLPVNEFGVARARVLRVSADIAQQQELASTFGESMAGSFVRVELDLLDTSAKDKMAPHLRSGERVMVRLHSRQRRVISMLFEFVRKWIDN